jgi:hypothetical protein
VGIVAMTVLIWAASAVAERYDGWKAQRARAAAA